MTYHTFFTATVSALALAACSPGDAPASAPTAPEASSTAANSSPGQPAETNTLLAEWTGPYGGVPAFDKVSLSDVKGALETGMAMNLAEIDAITANTCLLYTSPSPRDRG